MTGTFTGKTHTDRYVTYWFTVGNNKAHTYTGPTYKNYERWKKLHLGEDVEGLKWKDESRLLLDADSPVRAIQTELI